MLSPESSVLLGQGGFLSPDSKCFSFDARANGYARGEGIVALVVKPFHDAVRDGDVIRAAIRGIGSNQDGRTSSLTHPNIHAQEALIRHVYAQSGLDFKTTRYFEAHGKIRILHLDLQEFYKALRADNLRHRYPSRRSHRNEGNWTCVQATSIAE